MISNFSSTVWSKIEHGLVPNLGVVDYAKIAFLLPIGLLTVPFVVFERAIGKLAELFTSYPDPNKDFTSILKDSRQWKKIKDFSPDFENVNFLFGAATCTYQDSGRENCPSSQWVKWENTLKIDSFKSANLYKLYENEPNTIISRLKAINANSYRLSIEWSQIQPQNGVFNETALQVYVNFCKKLRNAGITPMITLHHFSEPSWFHKLGSFEKEENIDYFLKFCEFVFPKLTIHYMGKPLVEHFCTINEPAIEAFSRYVRGAFSPGIAFSFPRAASYLKGALKAHKVVYKTLKKMKPNVQIGIVHQYLEFEATNPLIYPVCRYLNRLLNEVTFQYFNTGNFELKIPFLCNFVEKDEKPETDFVGLQCYVRPLIGFTGSTSYNEPMTKMPFREDPESLYNATLKTYAAFKKPIIVTENGISTENETQRARYNQRALYALKRAADVIGHENVRGYYTWSFCDNFEWDMGWKQVFGAFSFKNGKLAEKPKAGMWPFTEAGEELKKRQVA